jgi:CrcB protein
MKGLEFIFLGIGSVLGGYLRYKITESPLIFNTIPALDSTNLLENHQYVSSVVNILENVVLSITALIGGKSLMSAIINN